jgi:MotA/TolQ/ExbB proton channel family
MSASVPGPHAPASQSDPKKKAVTGRSGTSWVAATLGVGLGIGSLVLLRSSLCQDTLIQRYVSHPIECAETIVFFCAVCMLLAKLLGCRAQRSALKARLLPDWDGSPQPPAEATALLAGVSRLSGRLRNSWVGTRVTAILDFVCQRRSAADLDDQMRALADTDGLALDNSYPLINYLNWSLPILGFLGTVLGITDAVAGLTPEKLESEISKVTGGLALAFDTTALALMLTMVTMFLKFLVERREQSVLEAVDRFVDLHLAHRFERPSDVGGPVVALVQESSRAVIQATEDLVRRQAEVWANAFAQRDQRARTAEMAQQDRFVKALSTALDRSLSAHEKRLALVTGQAEGQVAALLEPLNTVAGALEEQQQSLLTLTQGMQSFARALAILQENEGQLLRLQQSLQQNLAVLAASGSFEDAVHTLSAAAHLLTARAAPTAGWRLAGEPVAPVAGTVTPGSRAA